MDVSYIKKDNLRNHNFSNCEGYNNFTELDQLVTKKTWKNLYVTPGMKIQISNAQRTFTRHYKQDRGIESLLNS
jgi:hypothetical protein